MGVGPKIRKMRCSMRKDGYRIRRESRSGWWGRGNEKRIYRCVHIIGFKSAKKIWGGLFTMFIPACARANCHRRGEFGL